jgi:hypothetical protein
MRVSIIVVVLASVMFTGCSNSASSNGTSPSFNGKWVVEIDPGNAFPPHPEFDFNLTRTGDTLSSDSDNTIDNLDCVPSEELLDDSTSGSVRGNQFMLGMAIANGTPDAQGIRLTGTVAKNHSSVSGTYESDPGPCFSGKTGIFTATFIAPTTGTFSGTLINTPNAATSNATAMLAEDSAFNESASMTVTNNTCFSSLSSSPANPGFSIGRLTDFEVSDGNNTNIVDFIGLVDSNASTFSGQWEVTQGCTDQNGTVDLSATMPASLAASRSAEKVNSVLAQRFRMLLAHKRGK